MLGPLGFDHGDRITLEDYKNTLCKNLELCQARSIEVNSSRTAKNSALIRLDNLLLGFCHSIPRLMLMSSYTECVYTTYLVIAYLGAY
jgi:hypothetical protein